MSGSRERVEAWIRRHRKPLVAAWLAIGAAGAGILAGLPGTIVLRGAPLPRSYAIVVFLSLWGWLGLRVIWLWIWAWVVMAIAPAALFLAMRPYLHEAEWLVPLLWGLAILSALIVVVVVAVELRRRRRADQKQAKIE